MLFFVTEITTYQIVRMDNTSGSWNEMNPASSSAAAETHESATLRSAHDEGTSRQNAGPNTSLPADEINNSSEQQSYDPKGSKNASSSESSKMSSDSAHQAGSISLCFGGVLGGVTYNDLLDQYPNIQFPRSDNQTAAVAAQLSNHPPMENESSMVRGGHKYKPPRIDEVRYQVQPPALLKNTPYTQDLGYKKSEDSNDEPKKSIEEQLKEAEREEKTRIRPPNLNGEFICEKINIYRHV